MGGTRVVDFTTQTILDIQQWSCSFPIYWISDGDTSLSLHQRDLNVDNLTATKVLIPSIRCLITAHPITD